MLKILRIASLTRVQQLEACLDEKLVERKPFDGMVRQVTELLKDMGKTYVSQELAQGEQSIVSAKIDLN